LPNGFLRNLFYYIFYIGDKLKEDRGEKSVQIKVIDIIGMNLTAIIVSAIDENN